MKDLRGKPRADNRPLAFLLLLALGAIIGMQLWTAVHALAEHQAPAPFRTAVDAPTAMGETPAAEGHAGPAFHGAGAAVADLPSWSAPHPGHDHELPMLGCPGACDAGDMVMGLCVLALTVLTFLAFAVRPARVVAGAAMRRGPPRVFWRMLPPPAPSLTRLCISRT